MTDYIIFRRDGTFGDPETERWAWVGKARARSARSAIGEVCDDLTSDQDVWNEGEFVAVPARSWKPVTVKVETRTQLKFG